jgi:hypothetical protein
MSTEVDMPASSYPEIATLPMNAQRMPMMALPYHHA